MKGKKSSAVARTISLFETSADDEETTTQVTAPQMAAPQMAAPPAPTPLHTCIAIACVRERPILFPFCQVHQAKLPTGLQSEIMREDMREVETGSSRAASRAVFFLATKEGRRVPGRVMPWDDSPEVTERIRKTLASACLYVHRYKDKKGKEQTSINRYPEEEDGANKFALLPSTLELLNRQGWSVTKMIRKEEIANPKAEWFRKLPKEEQDRRLAIVARVRWADDDGAHAPLGPILRADVDKEFRDMIAEAAQRYEEQRYEEEKRNQGNRHEPPENQLRGTGGNGEDPGESSRQYAVFPSDYANSGKNAPWDVFGGDTGGDGDGTEVSSEAASDVDHGRGRRGEECAIVGSIHDGSGDDSRDDSGESSNRGVRIVRTAIGELHLFDDAGRLDHDGTLEVPGSRVGDDKQVDLVPPNLDPRHISSFHAPSFLFRLDAAVEALKHGRKDPHGSVAWPDPSTAFAALHPYVKKGSKLWPSETSNESSSVQGAEAGSDATSTGQSTSARSRAKRR